MERGGCLRERREKAVSEQRGTVEKEGSVKKKKTRVDYQCCYAHFVQGEFRALGAQVSMSCRITGSHQLYLPRTEETEAPDCFILASLPATLLLRQAHNYVPTFYFTSSLLIILTFHLFAWLHHRPSQTGGPWA
jgi:hypothetical protein